MVTCVVTFVICTPHGACYDLNMKNMLVVMVLTVAAFAATSRFVHFDGLGYSTDQAVENGHTNLQMLCAGTLSDVTVVSVKTPSRYDIFYHAEMTATCTTK